MNKGVQLNKQIAKAKLVRWLLALVLLAALSYAPAYAALGEGFVGGNSYTTDSAGPDFKVLPFNFNGTQVDASLQLGSDANNPVTLTGTNSSANNNNAATLDIDADTVTIDGALDATGTINAQGGIQITDPQGGGNASFGMSAGVLQVDDGAGGTVQVRGLSDATENDGAVTKQQLDALETSLQNQIGAIQAGQSQRFIGSVEFNLAPDANFPTVQTTLTINTTDLDSTVGIVGTAWPNSDLRTGINNGVTEVRITNLAKPIVISITDGGAGNDTYVIRSGNDPTGRVGEDILSSSTGAVYKTLPGSLGALEYDIREIDTAAGQYIITIKRSTAFFSAPLGLDLEFYGL